MKIVDAGGQVGIGAHGQLQGLGYHWELWSVASGGSNFNASAFRDNNGSTDDWSGPGPRIN